ncbi:MAG: undecaprenyl-diphosphatase [Magnetococcales bacterium]|nr:undecaprenyl-diphosphatase [Magnetococcales bacterium]
MMQELEALNHAWFLHINGGTGTPEWLIRLAVGIAEGTVLLLPAILLLMAFRGDRQQRLLVIRTGLVLILALGMSLTIRHFWHHPRPFVIGLGNAWLQHSPSSSFPSNHMTAFMAVGFSIFCNKMPRAGLLVLVTGLAVAWARIFLGVHFPMDMLGAIAVALLAHLAVRLTWKSVASRFETLLPPDTRSTP